MIHQTAQFKCNDPIILNKEREKLARADKVNIYVEEEDIFVAIKWAGTYNNRDYEFIGIKRF